MPRCRLALAAALAACGSTDPVVARPTKATAVAAAGPPGLIEVDCTHRGAGRAYDVGPGRPYTSLGAVPFEDLEAGDTVRVFWRAEPYREKLMIGGRGKPGQPIRVCGVPSPDGELPVIDGEDATTRRGLRFAYDGHQVRGLVVIGHRNGDPYRQQPGHFLIEGLEIRNATAGMWFTDRKGKRQRYSDIAAGIFVQRADHVTIRGCDVHDNQNGMFIGTAGGEELTRHVLIEGNHVHDNGSVEDYYEHNVYNEASGVTYQYNWFGSPRSGRKGVLGSNIKERSAGVVIRYNWIEDGAHLLDLVDAQEARDPNVEDPAFHTTFVYGNVLVRGRTPGGSMIHYGGDSGLTDTYRKGTLVFAGNTVVVWNERHGDYEGTDVFQISTNDEALVAVNNVFWSQVEPTPVRPMTLLGDRDRVASGRARFAGCWISTGWRDTARANDKVDVQAEVIGFDEALRGALPGFRDAETGDFAPAPGSPLIGAGVNPGLPPEHALRMKYRRHRGGDARRDDRTIGAFDLPRGEPD